MKKMSDDDECPSSASVGSHRSDVEQEEEATEKIDGSEDEKEKENEDDHEEEKIQIVFRGLVERTEKALKARPLCAAIPIDGNAVSATGVKNNIREYLQSYMATVVAEPALYKLNLFDGVAGVVLPLLDSSVARTGLCSMLDVSLAVLDLLASCKVDLFPFSGKEQVITGATKSIRKLMGT